MYDHGEWVWIRRSSSKHGGDDDGAIKHGGDEVVEGGGSKQDAGKHGGDRANEASWNLHGGNETSPPGTSKRRHA